MMSSSLPPDYFTGPYAASTDPWRSSSSWYERRTRAPVLAALPHEHIGRALEPGCSNGELTVQLARRCDRLAGDEVHDIIGARPGLERRGRYRDEDFVVDVWTRDPAVSVARPGGVV